MGSGMAYPGTLQILQGRGNVPRHTQPNPESSQQQNQQGHQIPRAESGRMRARVRQGHRELSTPVRMEVARPIDAFIGMGAEEISLSLYQIGRQARGPIRIIVG